LPPTHVGRGCALRPRSISAAEQIIGQQPHLTRARAVAEALKQDPSLYSEYSASMPRERRDAAQLAQEAGAIEQVCTLVGRPDLDHIFVEQSVPAKAVIQYFLDQKKEEEKCSSAGRVSMRNRRSRTAARRS
jgi:hypothetical protein